MEGCLFIPVLFRQHVLALLPVLVDEKLANINVAATSGFVKRPAGVIVPRVDTSTSLDQQPSDG
jgi:hypothetical protein